MWCMVGNHTNSCDSPWDMDISLCITVERIINFTKKYNLSDFIEPNDCRFTKENYFIWKIFLHISDKSETFEDFFTLLRNIIFQISLNQMIADSRKRIILFGKFFYISVIKVF